jgi:hypothetical protein
MASMTDKEGLTRGGHDDAAAAGFLPLGCVGYLHCRGGKFNSKKASSKELIGR